MILLHWATLNGPGDMATSLSSSALSPGLKTRKATANQWAVDARLRSGSETLSLMRQPLCLFNARRAAEGLPGNTTKRGPVSLTDVHNLSKSYVFQDGRFAPRLCRLGLSATVVAAECSSG